MKRVVLQEPRWFSARRFPIPVRQVEEAIAAKLGNPVFPERDGQWIDVVSSESGNARSLEPDLLDGADSGRRACVPLPTDPMRRVTFIARRKSAQVCQSWISSNFELD